MPSLIDTIKKVSMGVFLESKPFALCYGEVCGVDPIKINIDQKMLLDEKFLILTHLVKDHKVNMNVHNTDIIGTINGCKIPNTLEVTIKNSLVIGEQVILLRVQGGQQYIVLDRV